MNFLHELRCEISLKADEIMSSNVHANGYCEISKRMKFHTNYLHEHSNFHDNFLVNFLHKLQHKNSLKADVHANG